MNENQPKPDDGIQEQFFDTVNDGIQQLLDILNNIDEKSEEGSREIPFVSCENFKDFWEDVIWEEEET
jgi:hypothetical protein